MSIRKFLLILLALLPLLAGAQNLVVFDAGMLADTPEAPHYAVLPGKYENSLEWYKLKEQIERYGVAHAFDGADRGVGDPDWDEYSRDLKKAIEEATRAGNEEAAQMFRNMLKEAEQARKEAEAMFSQAKAESQAGAEGLDPDKLRAELLKHAVGGRFYYAADVYLDRLVCVQPKPRDNDDNVWGLMDAQGRMVVPARYWTIFMRDWPNENGKALVLGYRLLSDDKTEVDLLWDDGSRAAQQSFPTAKIFDEVSLVGVRFPDGGWGLMNADARIITQRRYKKFDWNVNDVIDPNKGKFVYGERDGVNYIISPADGSEIGTFKQTFNADGSTLHDVNYYPGKGPEGR